MKISLMVNVVDFFILYLYYAYRSKFWCGVDFKQQMLSM